MNEPEAGQDGEDFKAKERREQKYKGRYTQSMENIYQAGNPTWPKHRSENMSSGVNAQNVEMQASQIMEG